MRILIIGPRESRGALAAARALGSRGHYVGFGSAMRGGLVDASRWVRRWHRLPWPQQPTFAPSLAATVEDQRYAMVFAAGDDWLAALAESRDRLSACVPYSSTESLHMSMDKLALGALATEAGMRAPHTVEATPETLASWEGRAIVKAGSHWLPHAPHSSLRLEAELVADRHEAALRAQVIRSHGAQPLLQEVFDGDLVAVTTLTDASARPIARLQQRALGVWPVPAGVSTRAITVPIDPELATGLDGLLARLQWFGLAQAQFIVRGDQKVLVDLNARYYGSMALAAAAGLNLPALWVSVAHGERIATTPSAALGARYAWLEGDLRRAAHERRGGLVQDLADSVAWASHAGHSISDFRDPLPALRHSAHLTARAMSKVGRRVVR